ncbi:MAG: bifunctional folylpolyglutamate synthase/dihydrofolate synthase [Clostridia bacterium]|nr:bifunctional folylpolyglutamate synthase/dihydrofolate synthase [Clostridia bacterium]
MNHDETINKSEQGSFASYANGFQTVPRLGLERITYLMHLLGDPQEKLRCIHVAGTNGKGSTCAFTESILLAAGYTVGKYISPNLVRVNERISLCREEISDEDLNALLDRIAALIPEAEKALGDKISQFEIWTAAAFCYFAEKNPDYVILETGLGGEFDATNVITSNVMSILTQIDLDHVEYLGDTVEKIARTKSKIIKARCESGVTVVADQKASVIDVIREQATLAGTRVIVPETPVSEGTEEIYEIISYGDMRHLRLGLGGIYQMENAANAIACTLALGVSEDAIRKGLAEAKNPARFEMIGTEPPVVYDGGHNPNGVRSLKSSLDRYYPKCERTVVFACMADKDFMPSIDMLNDGYSRFVFTTVQDNPRAMGAEALCRAAAEKGVTGEWAPDLKTALAIARAKGNLVVACGSLYLYKDLF